MGTSKVLDLLLNAMGTLDCLALLLEIYPSWCSCHGWSLAVPWAPFALNYNTCTKMIFISTLVTIFAPCWAFSWQVRLSRVFVWSHDLVTHGLVQYHGNCIPIPFLSFHTKIPGCPVLTVLKKSLFRCYVMHIPQRYSAAEADLLCWLLSSAAREMHTCTSASYVITREGCTAPCF